MPPATAILIMMVVEMSSARESTTLVEVALIASSWAFR